MNWTMRFLKATWSIINSLSALACLLYAVVLSFEGHYEKATFFLVIALCSKED